VRVVPKRTLLAVFGFSACRSSAVTYWFSESSLLFQSGIAEPEFGSKTDARSRV
jgi:hypothetical protein